MKKIILGLLVAVFLILGAYQVYASPLEETITRTLMQGMKGSDVTYLQTYLGIPADGFYGPQTVAKVKSWQLQNNIVADGMFGSASIKKLKSQKVGSVLGTTADITPRIMYWTGKVNQHVDASGVWQTDPDGSSGSNLDKLTYCKKWYPNTISVETYLTETINTWKAGGNTGAYTGTQTSYKCVQPASEISIIPETSGTIKAYSCVIQAGSGTCSANIEWYVENPKAGSTYKVITANPNNTSLKIETVGTGNSGSASYNIGYMKQIFAIVDASDTTKAIKTVESVSSCATGTTWNGSSACVGIPAEILPDLTADDVDITPRNGQITTRKIEANIINNSSVSANTGPDSLITRDVFSNRIEVYSGSNGSGSIIDSYNYSLGNIIDHSEYRIDKSFELTVGNYSIRVCADSTSKVKESNENNNCSGWENFEVSASVPESSNFPDLIINDFYWTPENPTASSSVITDFRFFVTIKNIGTNSIVLPPEMRISVYKDDSFAAGIALGTAYYLLKPGDSQKFEVKTTQEPVFLKNSGTFTLVAWVDNNETSEMHSNDGLVKESNENNNFLVKQITIKSNSTTPSISVISPNGGEVYQDGQQIIVKWNSTGLLNNSKINISLAGYSPEGNLRMYTPIATTTTNDGIEVGILPKVPNISNLNFGNYFKIEITDNGNGNYDQSDNYFTIKSSGTIAPTIEPGCLAGYIFSPITGNRCNTSVVSGGGGGGSQGGLITPTGGSNYCSVGALVQKLYRGTSGSQVRSLQSILTSLGYLEDKDIDGKFGLGTRSAVIAFQYANSLKGDGIVGANTRNYLNVQWQQKCADNKL